MSVSQKTIGIYFKIKTKTKTCVCVVLCCMVHMVQTRSFPGTQKVNVLKPGLNISTGME